MEVKTEAQVVIVLSLEEAQELYDQTSQLSDPELGLLTGALWDLNSGLFEEGFRETT